MVLTAEEQAQLDALKAKEAEPEPAGPAKLVRVAADVLDVVRQLVQVHWASIAPEVSTAFLTAVAEAVDVDTPGEASASQPAEPADEGQAAEPEPEAFGTESEPGPEPHEV